MNERPSDQGRGDKERAAVALADEIEPQIGTTGYVSLSPEERALIVEALRALSARSAAVPSVPLDGAPRELWLAKGRVSGQWEHHAFREPTVAGWQRYVREDLTPQSATERTDG